MSRGEGAVGARGMIGDARAYGTRMRVCKCAGEDGPRVSCGRILRVDPVSRESKHTIERTGT